MSFRHWRVAAGLFAIIFLTSCASISHDHFSAPAADWQVRTGQLQYRNAQNTLIGDILVRYSKAGDFELSFFKGPSLTLLVIRQDASYAEVRGPLARTGWSGGVAGAPSQLRGWLGLRQEFLRAPNQKSIRYRTAKESFLMRF